MDKVNTHTIQYSTIQYNTTLPVDNVRVKTLKADQVKTLTIDKVKTLKADKVKTLTVQ